MSDHQEEYERLLGRATFRLWADLPRQVQEMIFERAISQDAILRNDLAVYLHAHHPRSAHPARPLAGRQGRPWKPTGQVGQFAVRATDG